MSQLTPGHYFICLTLNVDSLFLGQVVVPNISLQIQAAGDLGGKSVHDDLRNDHHGPFDLPKFQDKHGPQQGMARNRSTPRLEVRSRKVQTSNVTRKKYNIY